MGGGGCRPGNRRHGSFTLLFDLDQIEGPERDADWSDQAFYAAHDQDTDRLAIIGDETWREHGLAVAGRSNRATAVQFPPVGERAGPRLALDAE